ncbi:RAD52 family DNA repair protein [Synechococcus sp. CS-1328]|uniref:RAD52 family DNA repair protein n=1 Tax=Synechococcus sp. CS-1328 TaxID=2847976 RepID=UPI00223B64AC|nr:RAD52 family DNA repair protein [Synechococcus sp. CS-1328]MCT0225607.1 RAD52 family DNA repair protein [Synechococcus sp. CS-1328]
MTTTVPISAAAAGPLPSGSPAAYAATATASRPTRSAPRGRAASTLELLRESLQQGPAQEPALHNRESHGHAPTPAAGGASTATAPNAGGASPASPFTLGFSERQIAALSAPLDRAHVRQREQGRSRVSYLEGWQVIAEANRIFGFDGWQRQTLAVRCVGEKERPIGRERRDGWSVTYTARVRITVGGPAGWQLIREGSGAGHGIDADLGLAHESALKEAETDAMKRALMTFGNPFGLALYDKQQRQVSAAPSTTQAPAMAAPARASAPSPAGTGDAPLEAAVIQALQGRIKALPAARLEAFTRGFRASFRVPDTQTSIAGLITTARHQRWIEDFLG